MRGRRNIVTEDRLSEMLTHYQDGHTLLETATAFDISYGFLYRVFTERGWVRAKGFRIRPSFLSGYDGSDLVAFKEQWDRLDSTVKGSIAEGFVKVQLASMAFDVWEPATQNHRTDLVILFGHRVLKIQVKSASYDPPTKSFRTNLTRHRRTGGHPTYDGSDVDFFLVYCAGLPSVEIYVIPSAAVTSNSTPRLFPHREMAFKIRDFSWEPYRNAFHLITEAGSV